MGKLVAQTVIILILLTKLTLVTGQGDFWVDNQVRENYKLIIDLKLDRARTNLNELIRNKPEHLMLLQLDNYIDFYTIFIHEDLGEFKELEKNKDKRLDQIQKGNKNNPYYRLVQAEILMQWAIARLKFEEYYTALLETRRAHNLLKENKKLFPDFAPNNKVLAMIHAVIGTIPDNYRYLLKLFTGMEGSISGSLKEIESLHDYARKNEYLFEPEVYVIQALILLHLDNDKEKAWKVIRSAELDIKNSVLAVFIEANIARHAGHTDVAIDLLENRPRGKDYFVFDYLDFMLGANKLNRLDPDAETYLLRFTRNFRGMNYIKEAYQKLAWFSWVMKGDVEKAGYYYTLCLKNGNKLMDEDVSAHEDALRKDLPHPVLLKSRLLFDGGYYARSLAMLAQNEAEIKLIDPILYYYQNGRNHQMLNKPLSALSDYKEVLSMNIHPNAYQKCNAALQCGIIHEELGQFEKARQYYETVLSMTPDKYEKSLHQKAKAGIQRLKD